MADPSPFPFLDLGLDWGVSGPVPQLFVGDDFWPLDIEDVSETSVGECPENFTKLKSVLEGVM